ncbi:MAG: GNAT family N-acetyltransferase [Anaerolineae bacterium]|nr:GNAT family N-acetyltransferase [Anaerolineae bacterium]
MILQTHTHVLHDHDLTLRPMTEADWDILLAWNNDPEVLYYAEGDDITSRSLDDMQAIYRFVSQSGFCFVMEAIGQPVGECWLQQMNLERIQQKYPHADCRRIDLMIGEKGLWGQGYGTRTIRLLVRFAFEQERADYVFGCDIADYNLRSQKAFQKVGFSLDTTILQSAGGKAQACFDYVLSRADFSS